MQRSQIFVQIAFFAYPTCIQRPRYVGSRQNIAIPFGMEKLEWLGYPMVKKIEDIYSFWRNLRTWRTDTQTDSAWRHRPRLCIASRGKNWDTRTIWRANGGATGLQWDRRKNYWKVPYSKISLVLYLAKIGGCTTQFRRMRDFFTTACEFAMSQIVNCQPHTAFTKCHILWRYIFC